MGVRTLTFKIQSKVVIHVFDSYSVVAFLVAFCCVFFQNSTSECRAWVGSLSLAVAILIVWCIIISWGNPEKKAVLDRPLVSVDAMIYGEESVEETGPRPSINRNGDFG